MIAIVALGALGAATAYAHRGSTKYVLVERTSDGAFVRAEVEAVDASVAIGLGEHVDRAALRARHARIEQWIARGIAVWTARGERCGARVVRSYETTRESKPYFAVEVEHACPAGATRLRLRDDTVFDTDSQHEAVVHLAWAGTSDALVLRRGHREARLGEPPSAWTLIERFVTEGALHLATGYDHLLFLLSLLLTAGTAAAKRGLRIGLREIALVVTAFTIGHSVTLVSAALGAVVLPARLVESTIALSIVVSAALNLIVPEARRAWLALAFGLVHGFGFSSVLVELGLPRGQRVLALVSFNVGIELAQLVFVALLLGPLAWAAERRGYDRVVVRGGSVLIALVAGVWFVERAFLG